MNNLPQNIPATKKEIISLAQQKAAEIKEAGEQDTLAVAIEAKRIIDYLTEVTSCLKPEMLTEAQKYGKASFTAHNATVKVQELGVSFDFSVCGDDTWNELDHQIKELTEQKKSREAFLKAIKPEGLVVVDEITGDANKVYPPIKKSSTGVVLSY